MDQLLNTRSDSKNRLPQMTMCTPLFKLSSLHSMKSRIHLTRTLILRLHRMIQTSLNLQRLIPKPQLELLDIPLELIIHLSIFVSLIKFYFKLEM